MKKMLCVIAVLVLALALAGCTTTVSSTEKKPVVLASGHPDWAPVMYQDGKSISGIGPDVVKKVFTRMGFEVNCSYAGPWAIVQQKARSGDIDVIVALYKTKEREDYLYFSKPYTIDPIVLFFKKDKAFTYTKKEDLLGKKGIATLGDSYGQEIDDFIVAKNLDVARVLTPQQAFESLDNGRDYFIYSKYAGERVIAETNLSGFEESGIVSSQPFYIGVSKKSKYADRMDEINANLDKLIAEHGIPG
jgi:polar amino acid transport system substrate-binding protein